MPWKVAHARAIEFFDGLCTVNRFYEAISPEFAGVLDLSLCHSELLLEPIKRRARHCMTIINKQQAKPLVRLTAYRLIVHQLVKTPGAYFDALNRVYGGK